MIVGKPETGGKLLVLKSNVTNGVPGFENWLVKGKIPSPLTDTPYHVLICTSLVISNDFFLQLILVLSQKSKAMAKSQTLHEANWAGRIKFIKSSTQSVSS